MGKKVGRNSILGNFFSPFIADVADPPFSFHPRIPPLLEESFQDSINYTEGRKGGGGGGGRSGKGDSRWRGKFLGVKLPLRSANLIEICKIYAFMANESDCDWMFLKLAEWKDPIK